MKINNGFIGLIAPICLKPYFSRTVMKITHDLREKMLQVFMDTHPKAKDLPSGLSIDEKLVFFCEPSDIMRTDTPYR